MRNWRDFEKSCWAAIFLIIAIFATGGHGQMQQRPRLTANITEIEILGFNQFTDLVEVVIDNMTIISFFMPNPSTGLVLSDEFNGLVASGTNAQCSQNYTQCNLIEAGQSQTLVDEENVQYFSLNETSSGNLLIRLFVRIRNASLLVNPTNRFIPQRFISVGLQFQTETLRTMFGINVTSVNTVTEQPSATAMATTPTMSNNPSNTMGNPQTGVGPGGCMPPTAEPPSPPSGLSSAAALVSGVTVVLADTGLQEFLVTYSNFSFAVAASVGSFCFQNYTVCSLKLMPRDACAVPVQSVILLGTPRVVNSVDLEVSLAIVIPASAANNAVPGVQTFLPRDALDASLDDSDFLTSVGFNITSVSPVRLELPSTVTTTTVSSDSSGLSSGAIAGIVIGAVVGVLVVVLIILCIIHNSTSGVSLSKVRVEPADGNDVELLQTKKKKSNAW